MSEKSIQNDPHVNYVCVAPPYSPQVEDEIDLVALLATVWRWRWFIGSFTLACTLVAVIVTLWVMPVLYTSNAVIQPNSPETSSTSALAAAAQFLPITLPIQSDKSQIMLNYLNSRRLKTWLIEYFHLLQRFNSDSWDKEKQVWLMDRDDEPTVMKTLQKQALENVYAVTAEDDTSLIAIYYTDEDPAFAARVVAGTIQELNRYLTDEYVTDAKRNRIFIEDQLAKADSNLAYWEKQVPSQTADTSRIQRELESAANVYKELRKQYELAKIEEDKQLVSFKVLDPPMVPEIKSAPQRGLICIITSMAAIFVALCTVFMIDATRWVLKKRNDRCDLNS